MPKEYFEERLRIQEMEIEASRQQLAQAQQRGNKKLMGISRKRLDVALRMREMYERILQRERPTDSHA